MSEKPPPRESTDTQGDIESERPSDRAARAIIAILFGVGAIAGMDAILMGGRIAAAVVLPWLLGLAAVWLVFGGFPLVGRLAAVAGGVGFCFLLSAALEFPTWTGAGCAVLVATVALLHLPLATLGFRIVRVVEPRPSGKRPQFSLASLLALVGSASFGMVSWRYWHSSVAGEDFLDLSILIVFHSTLTLAAVWLALAARPPATVRFVAVMVCISLFWILLASYYVHLLAGPVLWSGVQLTLVSSTLLPVRFAGYRLLQSAN